MCIPMLITGITRLSRQMFVFSYHSFSYLFLVPFKILQHCPVNDMTLIPFLIYMLPSVVCYEPDANKEPDLPFVSVPPAATATGSQESSVPHLSSIDEDFVRLNPFEYGLWMFYTVLSLALTASLTFVFRKVFWQVLRKGFCGIRSFEIRVRFMRDHSITEIILGQSHLEDQASPAAMMDVADESSGTPITRPVSSEAILADVSEQFYDCAE